MGLSAGQGARGVQLSCRRRAVLAVLRPVPAAVLVLGGQEHLHVQHGLPLVLETQLSAAVQDQQLGQLLLLRQAAAIPRRPGRRHPRAQHRGLQRRPPASNLSKQVKTGKNFTFRKNQFFDAVKQVRYFLDLQRYEHKELNTEPLPRAYAL